MGLTRKQRNGGGLFRNNANKLINQMATVKKYKNVQASSKKTKREYSNYKNRI